jgi:hypothetical protein
MSIFNNFKKVIQYAKDGYNAGYNKNTVHENKNLNRKEKFKDKKKIESKPLIENKQDIKSASLTTEEIVSNICDWSVDLINDPSTSQKNAESIYSEFEEWIDPESDELDIFYLDLDNS